MSATAVKERPILFSGEMVRAILDGRKTMTRRVMKPQPEYFERAPHWRWKAPWHAKYHVGPFAVDSGDRPGIFGDFVQGERLWVRESHWRHGHVHKWAGSEPIEPYWRAWQPEGVPSHPEHYVRFGDQSPGDGWKRCPSIHMPRWASRITLEIVSVRVERLQDITEEDAIAEGVEITEGHRKASELFAECRPDLPRISPAQQAYCDLWQSINGPGSWDANPWVWVIEFKRLEPCAP